MPNFTDDGEFDFEEKRKNAQLQLEIERMRSRNRTTVALIGLVGVIVAAIFALFPTNSSGEPYKPVIEVIIRVIIGEEAKNDESSPTATSPTGGVINVTPFCAFLTSSQISSLQQIQDAATAIRKAEEFAGYRQSDYEVGETIPANVVIATNIYTTDFDLNGVIPVNNSGGYGLFLTTRQIVAAYPGTYWCVNETPTILTATLTPIVGPTTTPIAMSSPIPTQSFALIDTIEVLGNSNTGTQYVVPRTGRYSFRFDSGGYCTYGSDPGFASCLPTIWIFEEGAELWEDDGRTLNQNAASRIIAPVSNCNAGNGAYCSTIADAEIQGQNSSEVRMNLMERTTLTFIGVDHREAYLDNPGQVLISVYYLSE